jgi:FKBP-type peptidyl-prolyl cis-trans isomerase FkpA
MTIKNKFLALLSIAGLLQACDSNPYPGFETSEGGLPYKIYRNEPANTQTPKEGDIVYMKVKYEAEDTVFYDSFKEGNMLTLQYPTCSYKGSIDECISKMTKGDSALMWTSADSFFVKVLRTEVPKKLKPGSKLHFTIQLKDIMTKAQIDVKKQADMAELEKMSGENKSKEPELINEFLKNNKISQKPTASGLYIIIDQKGTGPVAKSGDNVSVHYTGKFLDGKVFDSSIERGEPIEFPAGVGQVIKGWDEALLALPQGTKARLVIPSNLAYGENGAPPVIQPFTPLTFEINLVKVTAK